MPYTTVGCATKIIRESFSYEADVFVGIGFIYNAKVYNIKCFGKCLEEFVHFGASLPPLHHSKCLLNLSVRVVDKNTLAIHFTPTHSLSHANTWMHTCSH